MHFKLVSIELFKYGSTFFFCRNVMHNLLEKIDSYLWAKKPNTLMPEVGSCIHIQALIKFIKIGFKSYNV